MAEFPSLPLWTDAYLADTRHLSTQEHGAYLLLLMEAWRRPTCSLPDDDTLLARLSGLSIDEWLKIKSLVLDFWQYDGRRKEWRQLRLVKERDYVSSLTTKRKDAAASRWNKTKKDDANAMQTTMQNLCKTDAPTPTPTIVENNSNELSKKKEKNGTRIPDDFLPDREWSMQQGLTNSELRFEFEKFKDYWKAKTGKDAVKKDWQATWRNWIRNCLERRKQNSKPTTIAAAAAEALEEKRNDQFSFDAMERQQGEPIGRVEPNRPHVGLALPKLPK